MDVYGMHTNSIEMKFGENCPFLFLFVFRRVSCFLVDWFSTKMPQIDDLSNLFCLSFTALPPFWQWSHIVKIKRFCSSKKRLEMLNQGTQRRLWSFYPSPLMLWLISSDSFFTIAIVEKWIPGADSLVFDRRPLSLRTQKKRWDTQDKMSATCAATTMPHGSNLACVLWMIAQ